MSIWGTEDSKRKLRETSDAYLRNEKTKPYAGEEVLCELIKKEIWKKKTKMIPYKGTR